MTIEELYQQRKHFHLAPEAAPEDELPLLEKQALIDEIFRGMPIKQLTYYEKGKTHMVTRGWPQLQCVFDFIDNKFCTWTSEEKKQWEEAYHA